MHFLHSLNMNFYSRLCYGSWTLNSAINITVFPSVVLGSFITNSALDSSHQSVSLFDLVCDKIFTRQRWFSIGVFISPIKTIINIKGNYPNKESSKNRPLTNAPNREL